MTSSNSDSKLYFLDYSNAFGISDFENSIKIYPNPSSDIIFIKGTEKELEATVTDLSGKQLLSEFITDKIDISCLEKGAYIINLTDGINTSSHKVIKN